VRTRLDKLVKIRERGEDQALEGLARAQAQLRAAEDRLAQAHHAARADRRARGDAALWELAEAAHRRVLQRVRAAQGEVSSAAQGRVAATGQYLAAHQGAEVVRRVAGRKRAELSAEASGRERRGLDEMATLRFNAAGR